MDRNKLNGKEWISFGSCGQRNDMVLKVRRIFTLLVPYIFNYIYVMQKTVHSFMLFNTILLNAAQHVSSLQ
jgi:hypothetical protein